jgi:hypothetical protein
MINDVTSLKHVGKVHTHAGTAHTHTQLTI